MKGTKEEAINLGDTVKDTITGFTGVVVTKCTYLNGCVFCEVQPRLDAEGRWVQSKWMDEPQLAVSTKKKTATKAKRSPTRYGPGNIPVRSRPMSFYSD